MSLVKRNNVMFPTFFDEVLNPDWFGGMENKKSFVPAVNILENDKGFSLALAVPGFKKEDFKIEVDKEVLTVSAEVKTEKESEDKTEMYSRKEFSFSSFKRLFTLPKTVNSDEINATYEAGVLTLTLPKKDEALPKPKRLIDIA
ncbi:molecular chaperone (small heat shock protein) [Galbibacter orientalis DSM 19592]|uniref:Molecular chaperone (Small heat shock protein) n=1 Tax=Galbibacter orientalis DSM 19592 TaxID=926559 RepID=I3C0T7_9FLAO|nr:Hsp20/alpha crystallin family protein [Galbibacter orientalis]EIJ37230.1 molecular chaperone (small heat shock protein) [Galbibacter orientalis DSM 19592]